MIIGMAVGLSACSASKNNSANDPFRQEFVTACPNQPTYQRHTPKQMNRYCGCIYDKTMKGLSEAEQKVARFYLFGQSGIDMKSRAEYRDMDLSAMGTASAAIGHAVKSCPKP